MSVACYRRSSRSTTTATPQPVVLPPASLKTGHTPKIRDKADELFKARCEVCIGVYFGKLLKEDPKEGKDNRIKRECFCCHRRTDYYCFGCRRFLCLAPPKVDEKKKKKHPKFFAVNTPVLKKGKPILRDDADGEEEYEIVRETGEWTCYHAAHQPGWTRFLQQHSSEIEALSRGKRPRRGSF